MSWKQEDLTSAMRVTRTASKNVARHRPDIYEREDHAESKDTYIPQTEHLSTRPSTYNQLLRLVSSLDGRMLVSPPELAHAELSSGVLSARQAELSH